MASKKKRQEPVQNFRADGSGRLRDPFGSAPDESPDEELLKDDSPRSYNSDGFGRLRDSEGYDTSGRRGMGRSKGYKAGGLVARGMGVAKRGGTYGLC